MNIKNQVVDYLRVLAWKIQEKKLSSKDEEGGAITVVMSDSEEEDVLDEAVLAEILAEENTGADDAETDLETDTEGIENSEDEESQDPFKLDLEVSDEEIAEDILSQLGHSSVEDVTAEDDEAETIAEQAVSQSTVEIEELKHPVQVRRPLDRDYFFIPEIFISLTTGKSGLVSNKVSKKMRNKWSTEEFPFLTLTIHDLGGGLAGISPKEKY